MSTMTTFRPTDRETVAALRVVGRVLGAECAYAVDGRFYFPLGEGWSLCLFPDDAGRFRVGACRGSTEAARLWSFASDLRRLADLAVGLRLEVEALLAQRG